MLDPRVSRRRTGFWAALILASILVAHLSDAQSRPAFLVEAEKNRRDEWTDGQLAAWVVRAERYLSDSPRGLDVREDVYLALLDWADVLDGGKSPDEASRIISDYFEEFADGRLRDEFEWARVDNENFLYEHPEEDASVAVRQAEAYERYLAARPDTRLADRIRLSIGWEYHVAFETRFYFPDENPHISRLQGAEYHQKAHELWQRAMQSADVDVVEKARYYLSRENLYYVRPPRSQDDKFEKPAGRSSLPRVAKARDSDQYVWISARALGKMMSEGDLVLRGRRVMGADWFFSAVADARAGQREGCILPPPAPTPDERSGPENVFERTVMHASVIVRGTVLEAAPGLYAGRPGVMLVVKPSAWIRNASKVYGGDRLGVFYPAPTLSLGGYSVCQEGGWPDSPRVGAEVLVLTAGFDLGTFRGMPHAATGQRGIIHGDDAAVRMHRDLAAADGVRANASFDWVVRHVRQISEAQER